MIFQIFYGKNFDFYVFCANIILIIIISTGFFSRDKRKIMTIFSKKLSAKDDTAAALCTAPGGAISIIRITGKEALTVAEKVWKGKNSLRKKENIRKMLLGRTVDGNEPCLACYMKGPASYTGEDTVELQCHGGSVAPGRLLKAVLNAGARQAEGGEFTLRAFINGKLDLTQAEAVADLIGARSDAAADLALRQLSGVLKESISKQRKEICSLLAEIESRMDFPEEDLAWMSMDSLLGKLEDCRKNIQFLAQSGQRGRILREGVKVVIAGKPNSGKSSLLNALLGYDRAIVTSIAGTTRDTLEESASFRNIPVRLSDTAGLREETEDEIEKIGIKRSKDTMEQAEVIFWVTDLSDKASKIDPFDGCPEEIRKKISDENAKIILVRNKSDLVSSGEPEKGLFTLPSGKTIPAVQISAKENSGMESLLDCFQEEVLSGGEFSTNSCEVSLRHALLLEQTLTALQEAYPVLEMEEWELAAASLHTAADLLGEITGETVSADILDEIFSRFCIGK